MFQYNFYIIKTLKEFEIKKQQLKSKYIEKKKKQVFNFSIIINNKSFTFDFLLPLLFNIKIKTLLININISNKIFITF